MTAELQQFASDNYAGICPEAWTAMAKANHGHVPAYGEDQWTQAAADAFRALFEKDDAEVFFAFNGTAANSLALGDRGWRFYTFIGDGALFMHPKLQASGTLRRPACDAAYRQSGRRGHARRRGRSCGSRASGDR